MIDYRAAVQAILSHCQPEAVDRVPWQASAGRILAHDCLASEALPPFDNAAMDGYALQVPAAGLAAGSSIAVTGMVAAGGAASPASEGAIEIMTGARMPAGYNAVIPIERTHRPPATDAAPAAVILDEAVQPGQHVRRAGDDVRVGSRLLAAGSRLGTVERTLLAAQGMAELALRRRPRVALIATGHELVDNPALPLGPSQIRNSNTPYLLARLAEAGAECVHSETVGDGRAVFEAALQRAIAQDARIVLSTGAVSMGRFDCVPEALTAIGATVVFHKCQIRPGKPILFARLPNGSLFFGLPGNPVSSAIGLRFFVEPALRRLLALQDETPWRLPLARPLRHKPPLQVFYKAALDLDPSCRLQVRILDGQESFRIAPLLETQAWAIAPAERSAIDAGELIDVLSVGHLLALPLPAAIPPSAGVHA